MVMWGNKVLYTTHDINVYMVYVTSNRNSLLSMCDKYKFFTYKFGGIFSFYHNLDILDHFPARVD